MNSNEMTTTQLLSALQKSVEQEQQRARECSRRLAYVAEYGLRFERTSDALLPAMGSWVVFQGNDFKASGNTYEWALDNAVQVIEVGKARKAQLKLDEVNRKIAAARLSS
jgi:hypothetical protein